MQVYQNRYGIPGSEIANLVKRFYLIKDREGWANANAFVLWASQNGYQKGLTLRKRDKDRPHGPYNSYFLSAETLKLERKANMQEFQRNKCEFCRGCTKTGNPDDCGGCDEWRKYFIANWDQKISIKKPESVEDTGVFRYEHPDLEREGIVFENCQSIS